MVIPLSPVVALPRDVRWDAEDEVAAEVDGPAAEEETPLGVLRRAMLTAPVSSSNSRSHLSGPPGLGVGRGRRGL